MSKQGRMEEPHFDPGGSELGHSSAIQPCPERLAFAESLHHRHKEAHLQPAELENEEFDRKTILSKDSGNDSLLDDPSIIPKAEHTLDSVPPSISITCDQDLGYDSRKTDLSICPSDFSSLGSLGLNIDSDKDSGVVMLRDKSIGATELRPSSDSHISPSKLLTPRTYSWHDSSARNKLRHFAHKMKYTDEEFEQSIAQLGVEGTDCDKLLNHLVKLRGSQPTPALPSKTTTIVTTKPKKQSSSKSTSQQKPEGDSKGLRRVVIDGSNVAMEHGLHQIYSCRGIELSVKYFQMKGHEHITVFVPAHRLRHERLQTKDQHILNELSHKGVVVKTPSRKSSKGHIASYEDRFILKLASMENAIVVSNDQFRDLKSESSAFRETIEKRILPFVFANDQFIPAEDPLGKRGPTLEQFLRVDPYNSGSGTCPYGRKCTYGTKCKFGHPEREESYDSALGHSWDSGRDQPPSTGSQWAHPSNRPLPYEQYTAAAARAGRGSPVVQSSNYPLYLRSQNPHVVSSPSPHPYYLPRDATHYHRSSLGYPAEYPMVGVLPIPPAVRAALHDQSVRSLPTDDITYHSRQPGGPAVVSTEDYSASTSSPQSSRTSTAVSHTLDTDETSYSSNDSSRPQPLTEHLSASSQYSSQSTQVAEGRVEQLAVRQRQQHPYDAAISDADPRYKTYFHLKNLFPEKIVRRVMNKYPNQSDPNKITAAVLEMQSKVNIDC